MVKKVQYEWIGSTNIYKYLVLKNQTNIRAYSKCDRAFVFQSPLVFANFSDNNFLT